MGGNRREGSGGGRVLLIVSLFVEYVCYTHPTAHSNVKLRGEMEESRGIRREERSRGLRDV